MNHYKIIQVHDPRMGLDFPCSQAIEVKIKILKLIN